MPTFATLIDEADRGDPAAAGQLFESLYGELHRLAERQLRRDGGNLTLGTTTLLHETYLSIAGRDQAAFPDRGRFLAYAARAMRSLIVDYARARRAQKRGRQFEITLIEERELAGGGDDAQLQGIVEGLERLATVDPKLAELVDLHFFCGFSLTEISGMRGVSERTVQRDWRKTRMLLEGLLA